MISYKEAMKHKPLHSYSQKAKEEKMPSEEEWKKLKEDKRDEIIFGQAVNIVCQNNNIFGDEKEWISRVKIAYERIKKAHDEVFK